MPRKMATRPTAPDSGFAALATAAPDDAAVVDDPVADPTLRELAAVPDAADLEAEAEAEAEADLALLAALTLSLALALAALPLGVGVAIAIAVSLSVRP